MRPPFPPFHLPLPLHHSLFPPLLPLLLPPLLPPLHPPLAGRCNQGFQQQSNQFESMHKYYIS